MDWIRCRSCGNEIDISRVKRKGEGNPSFLVNCPNCGGINNVKCRHIKFRRIQGKMKKRGGRIKSIKISSP